MPRLPLLLILFLASTSAQAFQQPDVAAAGSVFTVATTPNGHQFPLQNDLHSVSASSANDIWAVGQTTIHFDGTAWKSFPAPLIKGDNTSVLAGVVDLSPTNVWAVGLINKGLANPNQVIEHFDGTKWTVSPGPSFLQNDEPALESITALSSSDIWAAGFILTNNFQSLFPLFEHFDGTSWKAFETQFGNATMFGVSATATNDVWAVGSVALAQTHIEHFDGNSWKVVPSPNAGQGWNFLSGVAAIAPNDVWAVGYFTQNFNSTRPAKTLIEHWDGSSWQIVSSPNVGPNSVFQSNQLYGVIAISSNDVWAYGSFFAASGSGQQATLVMHWDGSSWALQPSPNPVNGSFRSDILFGGTVIPQGNLWLVGNEFGSTLAMNATGQ